jgi:hypothetical protein
LKARGKLPVLIRVRVVPEFSNVPSEGRILVRYE